MLSLANFFCYTDYPMCPGAGGSPVFCAMCENCKSVNWFFFDQITAKYLNFYILQEAITAPDGSLRTLNSRNRSTFSIERK